MNIIIAGSGKAGSGILRQLLTGENNLTVIDKDAELLERISGRYDIMTVCGNCLLTDVLQNAGVEQANLLIAFTASDEVNLLCCLLAKRLNPSLHTIPRIRNPEIMELCATMRKELGISMVVNPDRDAAREIYMQLQFPAFLKRETFAKGRVEIVQIRVKDDSKLKNAHIKLLPSIIGFKVLVCAVVRDGKAVIPNGDYVLREGDLVHVTAPNAVLSKLIRKLKLTTRQVKYLMIVGGDRISVYLAKSLSELGVNIKIIENDPQRAALLAELLPDATVTTGDGSSQDTLDREGCGTMDALITLTGLDEVNMVVSMYASSAGVPQVITKINRIESPALLDKLDIGSVISSTHISGELVAQYVRAMKRTSGSALTVHPIADGQVDAMEFAIDRDSEYINTPLKEVPTRENVLLSCIIRGGRTMIPDGDSTYQIGDTVVVVATSELSILQFNDIFID